MLLSESNSTGDAGRVLSTCDLCGCDQAVSYVEPWGSNAGEFRVVRCVGCGLLATYPRPASTAAFYGHDYYSAVPSSSADVKEAVLRSLARRQLRYPQRDGEPKGAVGKWIVAMIAPLAHRQSLRLPVWIPHGKILDVGCGWGGYLRLMSTLGWDTVGVEVSADAVRYAQAELGLDVRQGDLRSQTFGDESLDVVTFWDVIEHLHSPSADLTEAFRILKPKGWLLLKVPNSRGLAARLFGRVWRQWDLPRHLWHFDATRLRALVTKLGFSVVVVESVSSPETTRGSLAYYCNARWGIPHWRQPRALAVVCSALAGLLTYATDHGTAGDSLVLHAQKP